MPTHLRTECDASRTPLRGIVPERVHSATRKPRQDNELKPGRHLQANGGRLARAGQRSVETMKFVSKAWKLLVGIKDGLVLIVMLMFFGGLYAALSASPHRGSASRGAL